MCWLTVYLLCSFLAPPHWFPVLNWLQNPYIDLSQLQLPHCVSTFRSLGNFPAWSKVENMSLKVTGSFFSPCLWGLQRFGTLSHFEAVWLRKSSGKWNRCHKSAPGASSFLSCFFRMWIRCQWIVSPSCRLFGSLFILLPFCSICCFCSYILN